MTRPPPPAPREEQGRCNCGHPYESHWDRAEGAFGCMFGKCGCRDFSPAPPSPEPRPCPDGIAMCTDHEFPEPVPRLTKEQAAIIGAYTGIAAGSFGDVQDYAERVLGRSIFTHEFASPALVQELRASSKPDFLAICHDPKAEPRHECCPCASRLREQLEKASAALALAAKERG